MTTTTTPHPLPAVHTYETDDEMVVEVELPAVQNIQISIDKGSQAVTVPAPHPKQRRWSNPDALVEEGG